MDKISNEAWRPATDVDGNKLGDIDVSNLGNVRDRKRFISSGYYAISCKHRQYKIHILVARAFPEICGEWFDGCAVHHKNFDKLDNRAENLEIMTHGEHSKMHNIGKKMPLESVVKMSIRNKGKGNPMYGKHHSEETREKIRLGQLGRHPSEEARLKMSASRSGRKLTREHIENASKARQKKIYQYAKNKEFIALYPSLKEAARVLNCSAGGISSSIKGVRYKTYKGYIWSYVPLHPEDEQ